MAVEIRYSWCPFAPMPTHDGPSHARARKGAQPSENMGKADPGGKGGATPARTYAGQPSGIRADEGAGPGGSIRGTRPPRQAPWHGNPGQLGADIATMAAGIPNEIKPLNSGCRVVMDERIFPRW